ncbi:site-specific integrase [Peptoniphilus sp. EMRHCC_23]|uniref:tyrosine-type recombinase/integrase n=1 Tax=Peptoniphilus rachelemmaiella TaxID=2811779 RepID=UPI001C007F2E|nr:site-specific integrase [Peptoniphilus rachelemmaiella]
MSWKKIGKNKYKMDVERQVNGRRKRKVKTYTTDLKGRDLTRFMQAKENEAYDKLGKSDDVVDYSEITYRQFVDVFMDSREVEGKSVDFYEYCLRGHCLNYFKDKKIKLIKRADVVDFIKKLQKYISPRTGEPLGPKTIRHHRNCLATLFNHAQYLEIIDKNPADYIKTDPVPNQVKGRYYEPEDVDRLLSTLESEGDYKYYVFFVLQLYTGCRPSEMYGLTWDKIDFDRGIITIDQALVKSKSAGYVVKSTKAHDVRTKPMPAYIEVMLKKLQSISLGVTDYVFTNADGDHLGERAFREYLRRFCDRHGLPYIPPYGIRHTTGTLLAARGIPIANVAKQLGHASTQTTTKYIHATQSVDEEAENILAEIAKPKLRIIN